MVRRHSHLSPWQKEKKDKEVRFDGIHKALQLPACEKCKRQPSRQGDPADVVNLAHVAEPAEIENPAQFIRRKNTDCYISMPPVSSRHSFQDLQITRPQIPPILAQRTTKYGYTPTHDENTACVSVGEQQNIITASPANDAQAEDDQLVCQLHPSRSHQLLDKITRVPATPLTLRPLANLPTTGSHKVAINLFSLITMQFLPKLDPAPKPR